VVSLAFTMPAVPSTVPPSLMGSDSSDAYPLASVLREAPVSRMKETGSRSSTLASTSSIPCVS
jgi:hypothetical protein